jgi:hypothetical protein
MYIFDLLLVLFCSHIQQLPSESGRRGRSAFFCAGARGWRGRPRGTLQRRRGTRGISFSMSGHATGGCRTWAEVGGLRVTRGAARSCGSPLFSGVHSTHIDVVESLTAPVRPYPVGDTAAQTAKCCRRALLLLLRALLKHRSRPQSFRQLWLGGPGQGREDRAASGYQADGAPGFQQGQPNKLLPRRSWTRPPSRQPWPTL